MQSLEALHIEILSLIVYHLRDLPPPHTPHFSDQPPPSQALASYATVSRKWQAVVEQYSFAAVKTTSSNLAQLKEVIAGCARRRDNLRALFYQIDLPAYTKNQNHRFERRQDHEANVVAFQAGIQELWAELSRWGLGENPASGLRLVLTAEAAVPFPVWEDRWVYPKHSLTLDAPSVDPGLPMLPCVSLFQLAETGRSVHPAAIRTLLDTLVNLRDLHLKIWPIRRRHRALVAEHMTALAQALESPALSRLRILRIWAGQHTPLDHSYDTALGRDPDYPDGDVLNQAVYKLMQQSLQELYLEEAWMISPALWGANDQGVANKGEDSTLLPYLRIVSVRFPLMAYDGRWFYTGDPREIPPLEGDTPPPDWEESDSDAASSFGGFPDEIPYYRDGVLNGDQPEHPWMVRPDPSTFHPVARAITSAVLKMPQLQHLRVGTTETGGEGYEIDLEYVQPGIKADSIPSAHQTPEQRGRRRYVVSLGLDAQWDVPDDIREPMERRISADRGGEVIFYKM
ncbi:hypothetical protein BDW74DRAFT_177037 [Aspergillus multicolor]|uniref:uncharacterized protein n=1 Tax=Aspergillus multicolor TaxID=41759 RepID=UPI003CCD5F74